MVAGTLSKLGSSRKVVSLGVFLEHLHIPSVKMVDPENQNWRVPRSCQFCLPICHGQNPTWNIDE
jgi:hypothetical protein